MRNLQTVCVLIFVLLLSFSSFSQQYDEIIDTNKLWKEADIYWIMFGGQPHYNFHKFSGDTTINMNNYKVLWSNADTTSLPWSKSGFMREDSTGKVYMTKYIDSVYVEGLLYDFGMNINDSALITMSYSCDSSWVKAIDVDSVFIYDKYCKRIFTDFYDGYLGSFVYWIEGIGSIQGLTNSTSCVVGGMPYLICYMENDTLKFENPEFENCTVPTTINNTTTINELLIYPNPASTTVTIENIENKGEISIEVYNVYGQLIMDLKRDTYSRKKINIDISELSSGVYIFRVIMKDSIMNKTIMKE